MVNVFVLLTATLLVCAVPVLVVAQRRDRLDVSRRFLRAAVVTGVAAGAATLLFDRLGPAFVGLVVSLGAIYAAAVLLTAIVMSRTGSA